MDIIGVDCAVDPRKNGLAHAIWNGGTVSAVELSIPHDEAALDDWILDRVQSSTTLLLALDSPLGWPAALGGTLSGHRAGRPIGAEANPLFRRRTDQIVREHTGKQPLEVGADRIARTAVAALDLLDRVGRAVGEAIELGWNPDNLPRLAAIETYPAAWLTVRDLPARRYKDASPEARKRREHIVHWIEGTDEETGTANEAVVALDEETRGAAIASSHLLDALICVLCGVDFLSGSCRAPGSHEQELAAKEGWIWFRDQAGG